MGEKLLKAFDMVKETGGLRAEMRLAMKSGMSRQKAENEPDTPDKLAKMEQALKELLGKNVKL